MVKKIIITGANEGIGYNIVRQLLLEKNCVAVFDIQTNNLKELEKEYPEQFIAVECDVKDKKEINDAVNKCIIKFGGIDIAIHNACKCTFDSMENTPEEIYEEVFNVNYYGALRLTKAIISHMKKNNHGKIIFTSSGVGIMGFINISPYASSKGAIESLAKCLNIEYQEYGITFHIYHPPLTRTKSSSPLPIPKEFMADPIKVGRGLAKNINKKSFIICHSFGQKLQTMGCYLFPIKMGKFLSKMTKKYKN
jgi:NAD(P)-dependent dehydrogenase (short-subunit alcohol dehydrogenase family)